MNKRNDYEPTVLRLTISDEQGTVFDVLHRDSDGVWWDSEGETVAQSDAQLVGTDIARTEMPELISGALRWRRAQRSPYKCAKCGAPNNYVADYGAPGIGQHWQCEHGHSWTLIGGTFHDPADGPHELSIEDVR
jgi:hypothetical protein